MLSVTAEKSSRSINIRVIGHANFGPAGQDIVCAAASMAWTMLRSELEWVRENCEFRCTITHHEDEHMCWIKVCLPDDGEPDGMIPERIDDCIHMYLMGIQALGYIHPENVQLKIKGNIKLAEEE